MDAPQPARLSDAASRLRAAGLRATRSRLAVLVALEQAGGHLSADEVVLLLREHGAALPRSSVYNVLADLAGAGLVMRAEVGGGRERYEAGTAWHHHLVCRNCGVVVDVPCVAGKRPCLDVSLPGASIERAEIVFHGLCPACAGGWAVPAGGARR